MRKKRIFIKFGQTYGKHESLWEEAIGIALAGLGHEQTSSRSSASVVWVTSRRRLGQQQT